MKLTEPDTGALGLRLGIGVHISPSPEWEQSEIRRRSLFAEVAFFRKEITDAHGAMPVCGERKVICAGKPLGHQRKNNGRESVRPRRAKTREGGSEYFDFLELPAGRRRIRVSAMHRGACLRSRVFLVFSRRNGVEGGGADKNRYQGLVP